MKPKTCFKLTSIICLSTGVTSTTGDCNLLEIAIATSLRRAPSLCRCSNHNWYHHCHASSSQRSPLCPLPMSWLHLIDEVFHDPLSDWGCSRVNYTGAKSPPKVNPGPTLASLSLLCNNLVVPQKRWWGCCALLIQVNLLKELDAKRILVKIHYPTPPTTTEFNKGRLVVGLKKPNSPRGSKRVYAATTMHTRVFASLRVTQTSRLTSPRQERPPVSARIRD